MVSIPGFLLLFLAITLKVPGGEPWRLVAMGLLFFGGAYVLWRMGRWSVRQKEGAFAAEQLAAIRLARGAAERRHLVKKTLAFLAGPEVRVQFARDAARVEVEAAHEKAELQRTPRSKARVYEDALKNLRLDAIPDELQAEAIAELERSVQEQKAAGG